MKKFLFFAVVALALLLSAISCKKEQSGVSMQAVVTVKTSSSSECYFQLDDKTILKPDNMSGSPYEKQTRAHLLYFDYGKISESNELDPTEIRKISVYDIAQILTKDPVESEGPMIDPVKYGNDPMDIVKTYATVVEDGYITICFRSLWGITGKSHTFNLVKNVDSTDPYLFELRQNYNEDAPAGIVMFGYVAFDISDIISDHTKTYNISVRHIGTDGITKTAKFVYKYGTSALIEDSDENVPEQYMEKITSNIK